MQTIILDYVVSDCSIRVFDCFIIQYACWYAICNFEPPFPLGGAGAPSSPLGSIALTFMIYNSTYMPLYKRTIVLQCLHIVYILDVRVAPPSNVVL